MPFATPSTMYVLTMRSGVSHQNAMEYGIFPDEAMAAGVGKLLLEADAKEHPEWSSFEVHPFIDHNRPSKDSILEELKARFASSKTDTVFIDREEFNTILTIIDLLQSACEWRGTALSNFRSSVTACLLKISDMCPSDPDADQLDESPEGVARLQSAEVGDTARVALDSINKPWIKFKCPGNYGHADGCRSASPQHPYSEVLSCCLGRSVLREYAGEGYIVVKEHVWEHDDGARPSLAYLWPSEFNSRVYLTFEQAHEFITAEPGLPLGWVAMKIKFPEKPRG